MKTAIALVVLALTSSAASAQYNYGSSRTPSNGLYGTGSNSGSHQVDGHYTNSGTYVQPHQATNPNNTQFDNYNTRGNVNPYNGNVGTRSPRY